MFHPEFTSALANQAINTALKWLSQNNAPAEVIDLIGCAFVLKAAALREKNSQQLDDFMAENIVKTAAETTQLIWACGGEFSDGEGIIKSNEMLDWPKAE